MTKSTLKMTFRESKREWFPLKAAGDFLCQWLFLDRTLKLPSIFFYVLKKVSQTLLKYKHPPCQKLSQLFMRKDAHSSLGFLFSSLTFLNAWNLPSCPQGAFALQAFVLLSLSFSIRRPSLPSYSLEPTTNVICSNYYPFSLKPSYHTVAKGISFSHDSLVFKKKEADMKFSTPLQHSGA